MGGTVGICELYLAQELVRWHDERTGIGIANCISCRNWCLVRPHDEEQFQELEGNVQASMKQVSWNCRGTRIVSRAVVGAPA